mgnify:CR=1 FL=1
MKLQENVPVSYKHPETGDTVKFTITIDIPETGKDGEQLGIEREGWNALATQQYITNQRNEARRKAVGEVTGKAVGARDFAKLVRELGLTYEQVAEMLRGK